MNKNCFEIVPHIHLLKIPFESVFTSVFFVIEDKRITLYDTATTKYDVENYIFPCLSELEKDGCELRHIVVSHFHGDHGGGLSFIAEKYPNAEVFAGEAEYFIKNGISNVTPVSDGQRISDNLTLYRFDGHSHDCTAVFDGRTGTLLTADAFQGYGIKKYGVYGNVGVWLDSIRRAKSLGADNLITSHDYFPLGQTAFGKDSVEKYLDNCKECFCDMYSYIEKCRHDGIIGMKEIADKLNAERKSVYPDFPTVGKECLELVREYFQDVKQ